MDSRMNGTTATNNSQNGALLYVTDLVNDYDETLDRACQIAESHGIPMELVHVVDLANSPSHPDGQMGIQYRLEGLASRLRRLKGTVVSSILFGSPEDAISKRAAEIKAKLIAFGSNSALSARRQQGLVIRLKHRVGCPVVVLPRIAA